MKHASATAIASISELLDDIRRIPGLVEKKPGVFYRKSRAFLHFHEDNDQVFADVRLTEPEFTRLPATTKKDQSSLLRSIKAAIT